MLRVLTRSKPDEPLTIETDRPEDTEIVGQLLARLLTPGSTVSMTGDLGAGKTTLTRGLAAGLGCQGAVASPTFTLLMEHPAGERGIALYHFDTYRLETSDAFLEMGFDEYFDRSGICVIEWGDRIKNILPSDTIHLNLSRIDHSGTTRQIQISSFSDEQLRQLKESVDLTHERIEQH